MTASTECRITSVTDCRRGTTVLGVLAHRWNHFLGAYRSTAK